MVVGQSVFTMFYLPNSLKYSTCVGYQQQVAVLKSETWNYWLSSNRFVLMKQYY